MKYTVNAERAATLLSEAYRPDGVRGYSEEENLTVLAELRSVLERKARELGIASNEVGELGYFPNGGELAFRGELVSWRLLISGLLEDFSDFLSARAPNHAIILTFNFEDVIERGLECPTLIVLSGEVVGGFDLCDLQDTASLIGFDTASN
jgi:hypothetical protein